MTKNPKIGALVKVVAQHSGHACPIGTIGKVRMISGVQIHLCAKSVKTNFRSAANLPGGYVTLNEIDLIANSRKEDIKQHKEEIVELKKTLAAREKSLTRLEKYKDDEEELATIISECITSKGDVSAIYKLLKNSNIINREEV